MKKISFYSLWMLLFIFLQSPASFSQVIDWKDYYDDHTITIFKDQDLSFGNLIYNGGTYSISKTDATKSTISVTGIKYLDVLLEIDASSHLYLDGNSVAYDGDPARSIPFTLQASYQNLGLPSSNVAASMELVVDGNNYTSKIIPLSRNSSGPPGPPPSPEIQGVSVPTATAYVYIYGILNVGEQSSGTYTGNITVTVTYN